ncbi:hypothetical protein SLEP1_g14714 [Rubroshorea leprosula]|uniref:Uncharacterized protein n=1 Tax=Rubroshorea leprosula TaxID=152421 RepID=A0AAV5IJZ3_9ROSI|nr:hypothetical protein SLEP1_g14714 [Rubroshorea leprosula]
MPKIDELLLTNCIVASKQIAERNTSSVQCPSNENFLQGLQTK